MSLATPLTQLAELSVVEEDLAHDLAERDAAWAQAPSGLPGWTRAHVVGHVAGNAYGLVSLTSWADSGVETPMYPSSEARAEEIERRAALPWGDLLSEVTAAVAALAEALGNLREPVAARHLTMGSGATVLVTDLAAIRIREVEIHRVDLASDYRASDWSNTFTLRTLGELVPFFATRRTVPVRHLRCVDTGNCWRVGESGPDLLGAAADLLAWLLGRQHASIRTSDDSALPSAPAWV